MLWKLYYFYQNIITLNCQYFVKWVQQDVQEDTSSESELEDQIENEQIENSQDFERNVSPKKIKKKNKVFL